MQIRRASSLIILISLLPVMSVAQIKLIKRETKFSGLNQTVSVGLISPVGDFSKTHLIGAGALYSLSSNRFGTLKRMPAKRFGLTANAGADYYLGKKVTVSSYPYKYPGYTYLHTYGGVICNPNKKCNINLTGGPALRFYDGVTRFAYGATLSGSLSVFSNSNMAITPAIGFIKEKNADLLWSASLKATIAY